MGHAWYYADVPDMEKRALSLEVVNLPGTVPVRDSKDPEGPALVFPTAAWALFVKSL